MTKEIKLDAQLRDEKNGNMNKIRKEGFLPANVYGFGMENKNIKVKSIDFERVFSAAGESHLINLEIGGKEPLKVIVKDVQKDSVKDNIIHVDFYQVDMNKKIHTEIILNFIGESRAVKELGGVLIKNADSIEIKCLPGNLVDRIDIDLSNLNNFHDSVKAGDLKLPPGVELVGDADETIVIVLEPAKEEIKEEKVEVVGEVKEGEAAGEKAEGSGKEKAEQKKDKK
jgi:large subunit ribosomal protein L25